MTVFDTAGLMTDTTSANLRPPAFFWSRGYRWIVAQAQNGPNTKPVDLEAFRAAGFKVGVWGVTYSSTDFVRDGLVLAAKATAMHADLLVMDAEQCLKDADVGPLVEACGAFTGPKALSTLGAASGLNVFPIDWRTFVAADWHLLAQAYPSWSLDYTPQRCLDHWVGRAGMPLDRFHLTVDSSDESQSTALGGMGRAATPAELVAFLRETGISTPDVSVFMAEFGPDDFYTALEEITMQTAPKPAPAPADPTATRAAMLELGNAQIARWKTQGKTASAIAATRIAQAVKALGA